MTIGAASADYLVRGDRASTIVFPLPMDLLGSLLGKSGAERRE